MNFGIRVYSFGALALGVIGLVWGDFALVWQPVPAGVPFRTALAYAAGAALTLAAAATFWKRSAAYGYAALAILFALGVLLLHLPRILAHPLHLSPWSGAGEQMALVAGGVIAFASLSEIDGAFASRLIRIGRFVFGICAVEFGVVHFAYPADTASYVPKWIPPSQLFWAYATGAGHIAAGLAILSGVQSRLAAYLLTAMFVSFQLFVHMPLLFGAPTAHLGWVMNAMNLALIGAAWTVADSLSNKAAKL